MVSAQYTGARLHSRRYQLKTPRLTTVISGRYDLQPGKLII
jgi:hypothetical protein